MEGLKGTSKECQDPALVGISVIFYKRNKVIKKKVHFSCKKKKGKERMMYKPLIFLLFIKIRMINIRW